MDSRYLARALAITRIGVGGALLLAPRRLAAQLVGAGAVGPAIGLITRAMGARDVALGAGTVAALGATDAGPDARRWVNLSAACDAADALAAVAAFGALPKGKRTALLTVGCGAAVLGAQAAREMD